MRVTVLSTLLTVASASLYAPEHVACPADLAIRLAGPATKQTLHPEECRYTAVRRRHRVPQALKAYLGDRAAKVYGGDLDAVSYTKLPNIAISLSGGGDRAALYGAGVLRALDGREPDSVAKGTGGLLQSATYMSALSGGSWALSSFVFNGMPTIVDLVLGDGGNFPGWNLAIDLFSASTNATLENAFIGELLSDLNGKISNGFPVSFVDFWGRALARHFLPETTPENFFDPSAPTDHGATVTLSGAVHLQPYVDHDLPFPIIVSKPFSPNNHDAPLAAGLAPLTSVTYEFTPLEFGSFDNQLSAFIPIESLGSRMNAGRPIDLKSCATGFDRASFAFGCSSALFSYFNITNNPTWTTPGQPLNFAWNLVKTTFSKAQPNQQIDIGAIPNPFLGINAGKYEESAETQLRLVDGGESGENDPLTSLVVKARNVDIVIVAAADGDTTDNTPSGFALVISQLRGQLVGAPHLPPLPQSVVTFVAQGLNRRPTFFGCNATPSKLAGQKAPAAYPFLVYLPNAGPTLVSDTNTTQLQYPDVQTRAFLDAATSIATSGYSVNGTSSDPDWGTALACAVVERTRAKTGVDRTPTCEPLFARYCWNEKETTPPAAAPPARRRAVVTL